MKNFVSDIQNENWDQDHWHWYNNWDQAESQQQGVQAQCPLQDWHVCRPWRIWQWVEEELEIIQNCLLMQHDVKLTKTCPKKKYLLLLNCWNINYLQLWLYFIIKNYMSTICFLSIQIMLSLTLGCTLLILLALKIAKALWAWLQTKNQFQILTKLYA